MLEGLPPNNAAHLMRLVTDETHARQIADLVVETFDPAETAASAFELETSTRDWNSGPWVVEIYFGEAPDEDNVRELIACVVGPEVAGQAEFGRVAQQDWVASALEGLAPVRAGRFLVHGSHDRQRVRTHEIALEIEAALAFGTGHHGTTRGCLLMLDAILKQRRPRRVLDVGTGSGVLAMAAARALRAPVRAGDIDPVSVTAANSNARINGAGPWLKAVVARGAAHPALQAGAPYDLIFANILARPLRQLAPDLARLCDTGGEIVLSGLIARDVAGVLSAYAAQGFALKKRLEIEGWSTLLVSRSGAAPRPL
ncbi:MAG: 50S ribosomal protein L11 methyltransferase [Beijerinckiaceae bacterium]|nr:50S ribosomal protein L11 methyltransferase [Beijerinckiaceae bacterium]